MTGAFVPADDAAAHRCRHELSPLVSIATVAEMGALVGNPARANMLVALLDDGELSARELADRAGVSPQTASGHLARLKAAGLVGMRQVGRRRLHRLASGKVVALLAAMHQVGEDAGRERGGGGIAPLRTCHDHLAGRLAVDLAQMLTACHADGVRLTADGVARLARWGVAIDAATMDQECSACFDWSERRAHLGGRLGAAMLGRGLSLGWVRRCAGRRELEVTSSGERGFFQRFGISVAAGLR